MHIPNIIEFKSCFCSRRQTEIMHRNKNYLYNKTGKGILDRISKS